MTDKSSSSIIVSVILPVYNGEKYLRASIESILNQSFKEFELIVINDGSTDNTLEVINQFKGHTQVVIINQENQGLANSLNTGISKASGQLIARQDHDDISLMNRLEKQVEFLKTHQSISIVGTWAQIIEENTLSNRILKHPISDNEIKTLLLFNSPFVHPSVMFKKYSFDQVGGYTTTPELQPPEDYELWSRFATEFKCANLNEVLIQYRELSSSMSRDNGLNFTSKMIKSSLKYMQCLKPRHDITYLELTHLYHGLPSQNKQGLKWKDIEKCFNGLCQILKSEKTPIAKELLAQINKNYNRRKFGKILGTIVHNFS